MSQDDDNRFDGVFMSVIQQKGNIDGFFNTVFGFLRRNTDFFTNEKKAEEIIVGTCKKNFDVYKAAQNLKLEEERKKKEREEKKKAEEKAKREEKQLKEKQLKDKANAEKAVAQEKPVTPKAENPEGEKKEDKDEPPPKGNGGKTDKYIWTQTLEELQMYIPIGENINKKMLVVNYNIDSLLVQIKGQEPIINGKFHEKINVDDSVWTIEDGELEGKKSRYIHIVIGKWKNQNSWWSTPIKGDPEINTQKINPEPSKLEDLQGETKSTVEKMMFDMRQKQMGLPSSDELQKQEKLKEFMKAHPEMDFSKCKFN